MFVYTCSTNNVGQRSGDRSPKTSDIIIQIYLKSHTKTEVSKIHILWRMVSHFVWHFKGALGNQTIKLRITDPLCMKFIDNGCFSLTKSSNAESVPCHGSLIHIHKSQYNDVTMSAMASLSFTQLCVQTQIKENTKAPRHWPLCGEFTGDRWTPRLKGQ